MVTVIPQNAAILAAISDFSKKIILSKIAGNVWLELKVMKYSYVCR